MARFRKKPVEIEAVIFDGSEESAADCRLEWAGTDEPWQNIHEPCGRPWYEHAYIETLESEPGGRQMACPGDYIITGVKGERYPCKPDIFAATYEPAHSISYDLSPLGLEGFEVVRDDAEALECKTTVTVAIVPELQQTLRRRELDPRHFSRRISKATQQAMEDALP